MTKRKVKMHVSFLEKYIRGITGEMGSGEKRYNPKTSVTLSLTFFFTASPRRAENQIHLSILDRWYSSKPPSTVPKVVP